MALKDDRIISIINNVTEIKSKLLLLTGLPDFKSSFILSHTNLVKQANTTTASSLSSTNTHANDSLLESAIRKSTLPDDSGEDVGLKISIQS
jgi:hypothetical protein